jgi:hypothetical protein
MQRPRRACYNGSDHTWASMLDEAARWDDLVTGLCPMSYGAKGVPARCLVSVGPMTTAKASSKGWRLCLCPNMYLSGAGPGFGSSVFKILVKCNFFDRLNSSLVAFRHIKLIILSHSSFIAYKIYNT